MIHLNICNVKYCALPRRLPIWFWKTVARKFSQRVFSIVKSANIIIDVIVKAPRTKADKTGVKRVGAIDLGANPLYTVHTSKGVTISEDAAEREKLLKLRKNCEDLVERIAKRNFANQQ